MHLLMWHCDRFKSELTEKGRSPVREENVATVVDVGECLLCYSACEKSDETAPDVVTERACAEIVKQAKQLKVSTVVVHSFAHLFVEELSSPEIALRILKDMETRL